MSNFTTQSGFHFVAKTKKGFPMLRNRILAGLAILGLMAIGTATAAMAKAPKVYPGPYLADVVNVYDGDTINLKIHIAPDIIVEFGLRVGGVDTPELTKSGCKTEEKKAFELQLGAKAKAFVVARYKQGQRARIRDVETDKYGSRYAAILERETDNGWLRLDTELLEAGLGDPYGRTRTDKRPLRKLKTWCGGQ
ncbi:MAG: hypothetical protein JKY49_06690 [Cohaesibacteraceae bacterium]|nr:hypothetical protein [Cohaesibacteraceae bacterium]MBL4877051.1 hypothetical protein [Cohaesibacteraceae bacterium]